MSMKNNAKKPVISDTHCRRFKALKGLREFFRKGDYLIETFPGNEILRPNRIKPGNTGISIDVFQSSENRSSFIKEVEPVLFTETKNFQFVKTELEGKLGSVQGMIAGYLNEVERLRVHERQYKRILGVEE